MCSLFLCFPVWVCINDFSLENLIHDHNFMNIHSAVSGPSTTLVGEISLCACCSSSCSLQQGENKDHQQKLSWFSMDPNSVLKTSLSVQAGPVATVSCLVPSTTENAVETKIVEDTSGFQITCSSSSTTPSPSILLWISNPTQTIGSKSKWLKKNIISFTHHQSAS